MDQIDRYDPDAFDFLGPPFAAPAGGDLLLTIPQEDALSATLGVFARGASLVLVSGDPGSGRTLLADALADVLRARGLVVDQIARPGGRLPARLAPLLGILPAHLEALLAASPAATQGAAIVGRTSGRVWPDRTPAPGAVRPGRGLAVVVDDAGTWPEADLLLLASMAGLRAGGAPLLQAVLIGDPAFARRLAVPEAVSLRIPPLTRRQGEEYLAHRLASAGGSLERTMSPGAVEEILLRCGGNPGRIDRLADDCLAITARRRRRYVTSAVVRAAREAPRARRRLSVPLACALLVAAGGVLAAGAGIALAVHGWTPPVPAPGHASGQPDGQGEGGLFVGAGRFAVPWPSAQEPSTHDPAVADALPSVALAPVPPAPSLAAPEHVPAPAVPSLPAVGSVTVGDAPLLAVPDAAPPVLPPVPASPPQAGIAEPSPPVLADPLPTRVAPPPAPRVAPTETPPVRHDGAVVTHLAQRHDTATTLLHRIWGADDPPGRALFRSLNPGIDAQGPWPVGTPVTVPQRRRERSDKAASAMPLPPRPPSAPKSGHEVVRDNPAGQVRSGTPYFCRSVLPQNGAEDAYIRQVCGR